MVIENMKYEIYEPTLFWSLSQHSSNPTLMDQYALSYNHNKVCFTKNGYCSNEKHPNDFFSNKIVAVLKFN